MEEARCGTVFPGFAPTSAHSSRQSLTFHVIYHVAPPAGRPMPGDPGGRPASIAFNNGILQGPAGWTKTLTDYQ